MTFGWSYPAGVRARRETAEFRCVECDYRFDALVDREFGRVFLVEPETCPECGNEELEMA